LKGNEKGRNSRGLGGERPMGEQRYWDKKRGGVRAGRIGWGWVGCMVQTSTKEAKKLAERVKRGGQEKKGEVRKRILLKIKSIREAKKGTKGWESGGGRKKLELQRKNRKTLAEKRRSGKASRNPEKPTLGGGKLNGWGPHAQESLGGGGVKGVGSPTMAKKECRLQTKEKGQKGGVGKGGRATGGTVVTPPKGKRRVSIGRGVMGEKKKTRGIIKASTIGVGSFEKRKGSKGPPLGGSACRRFKRKMRRRAAGGKQIKRWMQRKN